MDEGQLVPAGTQDVDVSLIIIGRDVRDEVLAAGRSVSAHPGVQRVEVFYVDNGSSDGSVDAVRGDYPEVTTIPLPVNEGGSARNHGLRRSRGRYVMFLDSDALLTAGALDELVRFLKGRRDVGLVGPRLVYKDGSFQPSARRLPPIYLPILRRPPLSRFFEDGSVVRHHLMLDEMERMPDDVREVEYVIGACQLFSRAAVTAAGELDPGIPFVGAEDIDWCVSIRRAGLRIAYHPAVTVVHAYRRTSSRRPVRALQHLYGFAYFVFKRRRMWRALRADGRRIDAAGGALPPRPAPTA